jgi:hypothetical protein
VCLLAGCSGNTAPELLTINGLDVDDLPNFASDAPPELTAEAGETFVITLEIRDRQGDVVKAWWPWAPPGWDFVPEETSGTWVVPDDAFVSGMKLVLEDDHPRDPEVRVIDLPIAAYGVWDTGGADTADDTGF